MSVICLAHDEVQYDGEDFIEAIANVRISPSLGKNRAMMIYSTLIRIPSSIEGEVKSFR